MTMTMTMGRPVGIHGRPSTTKGAECEVILEAVQSAAMALTGLRCAIKARYPEPRV